MLKDLKLPVTGRPRGKCVKKKEIRYLGRIHNTKIA